MSYDEEYNIDSGKSAKFNAGILATMRINKILDLLNFSKYNPLAYNSDYNEWNFNLQIRSINNLYDEIECYMDKDERNSCVLISDKIDELILKYPILESKKLSPTDQPKKIPNESHWRIIKKAIERYERLIKRYGIKYQVLSATSDDDMDEL